MVVRLIHLLLELECVTYYKHFIVTCVWERPGYSLYVETGWGLMI